MHAKAWLVKRFPTEHTFTDIESEPDNKMKIELIITESGKEEKRFNGFGTNKKQCKLSAAKKAMHFYQEE